MHDFDQTQRRAFDQFVVRRPAARERAPYRRELARLLALAPVSRNHRCLEVGVGGGYLTRELLRRGARVTAVDFSRNQLDQLRSTLGRRYPRRLKIVHSSLSRLPSRRVGLFDRVFAVNLIHHLARPLDGVARLACFLKPKGALVLMEPNGQSPLWRLIRGLVWISPSITTFNWKYDRNLRLITRETMKRAFVAAGLTKISVEPNELVPKIVLARLPPFVASLVYPLERIFLSGPGSVWALNLLARGVRIPTQTPTTRGMLLDSDVVY